MQTTPTMKEEKSVSILWKGLEGVVSDGTATMSTNTMTPFSLAEDNDTTVVVAAAVALDDCMSGTDGIDVVSAAPTPETFWQRFSLWFGRIVRSHYFRRAVLLSILMNSILMGVATLDWIQEEDVFHVIDTIIRGFRILFTMEIAISMCHYQTAAFHMGWIVLDVIVIGLSWTVSISILILRSFRLIRAFRKASGDAELNHLVEALLQVIPKMTAVVFLLFLVFYMFAVIFTDLYQDLYAIQAVSYNYFGRVDRSAFTLFQIMTLDGWSDIAKEVMDVAPWSGVLMSLFIVFTTFVFGSLVIAVMGEALTTVSHKRMLKALEVDHANSAQQQQLARLEVTVEKLNSTVEHLVLGQHLIQEALDRIILENKKADSKDSD